MPLIPAPPESGTGIGPQLAEAIRWAVAQYRPRRVFESGTYKGTGTTAAIEQALDLLSPDAEFVSVECDPECHRIAKDNAKAGNYRAELINGLSLPRRWLPTADEIQFELRCANELDEDLYVDHPEADRHLWYFNESDKPDVEDDQISKIIGERWGGRCDLIVLDSAGHLGLLEFRRCLATLEGPCVFVADDTLHVKHAATLNVMRGDPEFQILRESDERFGFAVMRYEPASAARAEE